MLFYTVLLLALCETLLMAVIHVEIEAAAETFCCSDVMKHDADSVSSHLCSRFLRLSRSGWSTPGSCHILHSGNSSYATAVNRKNFNFIPALAAVQVCLHAFMLDQP